MITQARPATDEPTEPPPVGHTARNKPPRATAYGTPFWLAYCANTSLMIGISLLFRYADFVHSLGGSEWELGWIVGVGMLGSLAMRLVQGVGIDTYGPRMVWLWSAALFVASCLAHLMVGRVDTPTIYIVRIVFNCAIAGFFGASITYVASRAPIARMAEVVGTLGTSGFLGMVVGPLIGDYVLGAADPASAPRQMFVLAAGFGTLALLLSSLATWGHRPPPARKRLPVMFLIRRYHPGATLLVGLAMGYGIGLTQNFVRPFTVAAELSGIATFFIIYAHTAFITRIFARGLPQRVGLRWMMLVGLAFLSLGLLLFLVVAHTWLLAIPAITIGIAHAPLFPAIMAVGSTSFPERYRGLGTTLMLAMYDGGTLLGAPLAGGVLRAATLLGIPAYPAMFVFSSVLLAAVGTAYALLSRTRSGSERESPSLSREGLGEGRGLKRRRRRIPKAARRATASTK